MEMQKLKMANYYGNYLQKSIKATTINRASIITVGLVL